MSWGKRKANQRASENARTSQQLEPLPVEGESEKQKGKEKPMKKMPVCCLFILLCNAHTLCAV
jgi:hypothetical protein